MILFILLLLAFFAQESRAETVFEVGINNVSGEWTTGVVALQERITPKYAIGLGYMQEQKINTCGRPDCGFTIQEQLFVGFERLVRWNRVTLGIGPYWFQNKNRITSCNFNARLSAEYRLSSRMSVKLSHFSNAGTCKELTVRADDGTHYTNRFNLGQDSLLLTYRF